MILILLSLFYNAEYVGVDLGSQFLKFSKSTDNGQVQIYTNPVTNTVIFPAAAALKFSKPHTPPFSAEDFADIEIKYSGRASSIIKHNKSLGFEFTPMMIERNFTDEFNKTTVATAEELLPLLLYQSFYQIAPFQKVSISLPSYYTRKQFRAISNCFMIAGADIDAVVDDLTSVLIAYSSLRVNRFTKEPKHVLFIDVGASATRAYSAIFTYSKEPLEHSSINQTSYDFTEKVSGISFAKRLASKLSISLHKAMKTIIRTGCEGKENYLLEEASILSNFVHDAVETASKVKPIDEVQLIGGASTIRFVVDTIKVASNHTIRRDFNANEAVALGAAMSAMMMNENSAYIPSYLTKLPTMSINITCGNETVVYCQKNAQCSEIVQFDQKCDRIAVEVDKNHILSGTESITYYIVNQSLPENASIRLFMQEPDANIREAQYCSNEECQPLNLVESVERNNMQNVYEFFTNWMVRVNTKGKIGRIHTLLSKLGQYLEKIESTRVEATYPATEEMKNSVAGYQELEKKGLIESLNYTEVDNAVDTLENVAKDLHLKID